MIYSYTEIPGFIALTVLKIMAYKGYTDTILWRMQHLNLDTALQWLGLDGDFWGYTCTRKGIGLAEYLRLEKRPSWICVENFELLDLTLCSVSFTCGISDRNCTDRSGLLNDFVYSFQKEQKRQSPWFPKSMFVSCILRGHQQLVVSVWHWFSLRFIWSATVTWLACDLAL